VWATRLIAARDGPALRDFESQKPPHRRAAVSSVCSSMFIARSSSSGRPQAMSAPARHGASGGGLEARLCTLPSSARAHRPRAASLATNRSTDLKSSSPIVDGKS